MEDKQLVVKALLECYPYIDDMYDALTRMIASSVSDGFYAIFANEQMRLYERIMRYNDRKIGLYNMKYLIEEGTGRKQSILRARYMEGKSASVIASESDIPLRTVYLRLKQGIATLAVVLEKMGFDKKRILKEFGNEPLFSSMLKRVIEEDDEAQRVKEAVKKTNIEPFGSINHRRNRRSRPRRDTDDCASA